MSRASKRRKAYKARKDQPTAATQNFADSSQVLPSDSAKQVAFLAAYAMLGIIGQAAKAAGCNRESHRYWMETDPDYPARFAEAQSAANDRLESEARRRATQGVEKVKFYKGAPIIVNGKPYTEHEYSDRLLEFLLKGELHDKYAERKKVETTASMTILDPQVQAALIEFDTEEIGDVPDVPEATETPDA